MKLLVIIAIVLLMGCPLEGTSAGPVEVCTEVAEQCRLSGGQLGVCAATMDGDLLCMPQH